ncbi:imidazole glycerol phosphate synthase amidotransferase subunit [alpha proteobacterium U9-1i]|nr:imidazole glycerol phosphate synthase amidotransferase subunit [alpha proteobacterium U9-1i]
MARIALIDYGAGNIRSAERALMQAGGDVVVTDDPAIIANAERIVLPGQGAFDDCMAGLRSRAGLIEALNDKVLKHGAPFLGICVGMQLLAEIGLEHGEHNGLGWIGGVCRALEVGPTNRRPHMGWNEVAPTRAHPVFDGLAPTRHCYFAHSYILDPPAAARAATTEYGETFASAVARDNIVGVQFHPEKSQQAGLDLLARFIAWSP